MTRKWRVTGFALALAGVLTWGGLSWAQCGGYGPRHQGYQACQAGWQDCGGPGYANCPNYAGNSYCPQGYGNYARGERRACWNSRDSYCNPPTPATTAAPKNQ
jgi:hypothetical protein